MASRTIMKLKRSLSKDQSKVSSKEFSHMLQKLSSKESSMEEFCIPSFHASYKQFTQIIEGLYVNQTIRKLNLSGNAIDDSSLKDLLRALDKSGNNKLMYIDLTNNNYGLESEGAIEKFLSKHLHVVEMKLDMDGGSKLSTTGVVNTDIYDVKPFSKGGRKRIQQLIKTNASVTKFALKKTDKLTCSGRKLVLIEQFIPESWFGRLRSLDLSENCVTVLPKAFKHLSVLEELVVPHNLLSRMPDWIDRLTELRLIDYSHNKLPFIPETITNLQKLESLCFSNNEIQELPLSLGMISSLYILNANGNPITNVATEIVEMSRNGNPVLLHHIRNTFLRQTPTDQQNFLYDKDIDTDNLDVRIPLRNSSNDSPIGNLRCISRIGEYMWFGAGDGSVHTFDTRRIAHKQTHKFLDSPVKHMLHVPSSAKIWFAHDCGSIVIYSLTKSSTKIEQVSTQPLEGLALANTDKSIWVVDSSNTIRVLIDKGKTIEVDKTIQLSVDITAIAAYLDEMWLGTGNGTILVLKQATGKKRKTIEAHLGPICDIVFSENYCFTSSMEPFIKIWNLSGSPTCTRILRLDTTMPQKMVYGGKKLYTTGGPMGNIVVWDDRDEGFRISKCFLVRDETDAEEEFDPMSQIQHLAWSPSPDRVWTINAEGMGCCYEAKRGKKTIQRLASGSLNASIELSEVKTPASPTRFVSCEEESTSDTDKEVQRVLSDSSDLSLDKKESSRDLLILPSDTYIEEHSCDPSPTRSSSDESNQEDTMNEKETLSELELVEEDNLELAEDNGACLILSIGEEEVLAEVRSPRPSDEQE